MKSKLRKLSDKAVYYLEIVGVGVFTGLFAGIVITLFNLLFERGEELAVDSYLFFAQNPVFIPLLFVALFLGAIIIGGVLKLLPILRGSGFAQTEGAAQGLYRFKWYEVLTGMFASSLFVVVMGLSGGSEGPSLFIGAACGDASGALFRRSDRRYPITSGASAGLAVALNAPLTGIIFAYEEAHKKFTPEVFVCSFSSVAVAIVARELLFLGMGMSTGPFLAGFVFPDRVELKFCLYVLMAAIAVALAGAIFYHLYVIISRLFGRITFLNGIGKYLAPFFLAGAAGLLTVYVTGSGRAFLFDVAAGEVSILGMPLWGALIVAFALRFAVMLLNMAAGLPACASVPMFMCGAALGALLSMLFEHIGMDPACRGLLIALCMVTFYMTVVRAPITGIIMTVELTGEFAFLLPAVICAAVAYLIGAVFHTKPVYEVMLEERKEDFASSSG